MRLKFLYTITAILVFSLKLNAKDNFSWIIVVNTYDCINCLNGLNRVNDLDARFPKTIVFSQKDRRDSAVLIKKLFLEDFKGKIVFNDSLFNKFKSNSGLNTSSVTLYNEQNDRFITTALLRWVSENIDMNRFLKERDTIQLSENVFGGYRIYSMSANDIYTLNLSGNVLKVFSRLDNKKEYEIKLSDSLLKKGYAVKYGIKQSKVIFENTEAYIRKTHLIGGADQMKSFQVLGDTLYLEVKQPILMRPYKSMPVPQSDTMLSSFKTLFTFVSGKLIDVTNIENYMSGIYADNPGLKRNFELKKSDKHYHDNAYYLGHSFFIYNTKLYTRVFATYLVAGGKNWAMAEFKKTENKTFIFSRYVTGLPEFYIRHRIGYKNLTPININCFESYFVFQKGDSLYSVNSQIPSISLSFVPKGTTVSSLFLPKGIVRDETIIGNFKIDKQYLYLLVDHCKGSRCSTHYYKYDLRTKKVVFEKTFTEEELPEDKAFARIDPFDYSCVVTPISGDKLLRIKINDALTKK